MPQKKRKHAVITAESDYTQFLKSIEPITISLINSRFRVDRDQYFTEKQKKLSINWSCVPKETGDDYFEANAEVVVRLGSLIGGKFKPSVEINATFEMHLHASKPIDPALVKRFADGEVKIMIWPYFREYVSSVSGRMHIPPLLLPFGTRN